MKVAGYDSGAGVCPLPLYSDPLIKEEATSGAEPRNTPYAASASDKAITRRRKGKFDWAVWNECESCQHMDAKTATHWCKARSMKPTGVCWDQKPLSRSPQDGKAASSRL